MPELIGAYPPAFVFVVLQVFHDIPFTIGHLDIKCGTDNLCGIGGIELHRKGVHVRYACRITLLFDAVRVIIVKVDKMILIPHIDMVHLHVVLVVGRGGGLRIELQSLLGGHLAVDGNL